MKSVLGALIALALAGLPGGALPAAEQETSSAAGQESAPASAARSDGAAPRDEPAATPADELLVDAGPPPGTCPVTEEIVDSYCAEHPDDAACRARRGE